MQLGSLLDQKVDALVNSCNPGLKHLGGIARAISLKAGMSRGTTKQLRIAGSVFQKACNEYTTANGDLAVGQVFVAPRGNIWNCQVNKIGWW